MKTRILAIVFGLSLLALGCDNDSNNNNGSDASVSLIGKWNIS